MQFRGSIMTHTVKVSYGQLASTRSETRRPDSKGIYQLNRSYIVGRVDHAFLGARSDGSRSF
jgi:hypothetical protein